MLIVALVGTALGLGLVAVGPWRAGLLLVGAVLVLCAVARLLLPERQAGQLRIRRRGTDVLTMAALGTALVVLTLVVPDQPPM